jgi:molybdopterin/thiamine biosynthesis adenylyltransferase
MLTEWDIETFAEKWTSDFDLEPYDIIISAVDNITARTELYNKLKDTKKIFIDGRMAGNAIEIYTVNCDNKEDQDKYAETLFTEEETIPVPCSERAVVYNVFVIAGLMGDLIGKIANEQELPKEIIVDLNNFFLFT